MSKFSSLACLEHNFQVRSGQTDDGYSDNRAGARLSLATGKNKSFGALHLGFSWLVALSLFTTRFIIEKLTPW